jgi:DNA-binding transcriptional LysR family regulator
MELEARLRAFAGFVRRRSFSGAADELHISQPAVSKHIADLERQLGVTLVERRTRALTVAGEHLANHVLRAESLLAQAMRAVAALREPGLGTLSLMASGTPGTYLLPDMVGRFQRSHPGVRIEFALGTSSEVVTAVRSHRAELGIVGGFVAAPEIDAEPLIEDDIVIVGPPGLGDGKRLGRDDLESILWISREEGSATSLLADNAIADMGNIPKSRLALPAWESIKLAVRHGHGIAAFSRIAVAEELEAGTLVEIPFAPWKVRRIFSIVRIRDAALTPAAQLFLEMLHTRWKKPASPTRRRRQRK